MYFFFLRQRLWSNNVPVKTQQHVQQRLWVTLLAFRFQKKVKLQVAVMAVKRFVIFVN